MPKRTLQGVVVSDKQDKTVVVRVDRRFTHPIYKKTIRQSKKYHAHDQNNEYAINDIVWIEETKPISKLKTWKVTGGEKRGGTRTFVPNPHADQSNRERNEPSNEALRKANVNQAPVVRVLVADFGKVYTQLVERLLAQGPNDVDRLAGAQLSFILEHMNTNAIHSRIDDLLIQLDSADKKTVSDALMTLSILLPRLDLKACLRDPDLRKTLYGVPDRLMTALTQNLDSAAAAKKAAFALVAAMYPHHYSGDQLAANEEVALADLQSIFRDNNVTSFFTVNTKAATDVASIDARLWNGVPFRLNGVRPSLVPSQLFNHRGDFDICQVKGAKKVDVIKTDRRSLSDGQFGGLTAKLRPDPSSAVHNKVVLYFGNDKDVYRREVFDLKTLFPKHAP